MTIHSHTRADRSEVQGESSPAPIAGGLWKLLVAAILILLGLIIAMEFFGAGDNDFITPNPTRQTIVE
ncbi:hypothetical protein PMI07_000411 [Rhizobium sp. CF080]|uniref:hypothetical protein n=1 Tax=Rhizobium sp. (strain CF080) TaxID=1144310 RepID=UPI000271ACBD|nr:hypothetical protein [Rhizobium sp. CF080]EUB97851.1 hypothetical protein PMI07_000411 [Rhizobium sp. CF080]